MRMLREDEALELEMIKGSAAREVAFFFYSLHHKLDRPLES